MKETGLSIFLILIFACNPDRHVINDLPKKKYSMEDTVPSVEYFNEKNHLDQPAVFLNGHRIDLELATSINPDLIESITVIKDSSVYNDYPNGKVIIKSDQKYEPSILTLEDLIFKYTNLEILPLVAIIENKIIYGDFSNRYLNEKDILKIIVHEIGHETDAIKHSVIQLVPRTQENVDEANIIRIRGLH